MTFRMVDALKNVYVVIHFDSLIMSPGLPGRSFELLLLMLGTASSQGDFAVAGFIFRSAQNEAWWRWRESNPRPKLRSKEHLHT